MRHGEDNAPALDAGSGAEQGKQLGHLQREYVAYPFLGCEVHLVKASTLGQYLRHLSGVDSVIDPPEFSDLGYYLFNTNGIGHFRKQF
jgi:hypothetical protein